MTDGPDLQTHAGPRLQLFATYGNEQRDETTPGGLYSALVCSASRRQLLLGASLVAALQCLQHSPASAVTDAPAAVVRPELTPDQSLYAATDPQLREAAQLLQRALSAQSVQVR
jgi:hypothetical protein